MEPEGHAFQPPFKGGPAMPLLTNTTKSKVLASIAVWFIAFLILVFGGFTFQSSEDWRWTTLGGMVLAAAAVVSALICSSGNGRAAGQRLKN